MTNNIEGDNDLYKFLRAYIDKHGSVGHYPLAIGHMVGKVLDLLTRFENGGCYLFPVEGKCFFCGHTHEPYIGLEVEGIASADEKVECNRYLVSLAVELLDCPRKGIDIDEVNDLLVEIVGLDRRGLVKFCDSNRNGIRLKTTKKGVRVLGVNICVCG